ncbi:mannosyltransferase [Aetokthonos hydrillicola Thurmond2011]|jgi:hypothetical protein|uniref:Mannosyltransferase n=1 Tax=Aetokthonos hydrillicola Thurmond2011 TaxID=2712845 RepID=A0AAP5I8L9_9CYAN|nr:mannosyltransferase [Aetokthonos hydrillicola]MBO3462164.1 mannosyltransferase [Aetokthonos hydrillicola CCALA 1050]MBW4587832.1 mannosyltransferase [Aetokthonos hydrillicola CCALA 1050]MDR9894480.1 mannosyltransferase [Aetokthonos hydrillicola Thurmond2011]
MTRKRVIITCILPLIICSAFILCAAFGMFMYPEAFHKFFSESKLLHEIPSQRSRSYYWDVELYAYKALNPSCDAFYPLWPFIIRNLFHPQSIEQAAHYFSIVATSLFFISNWLLFFVFQTGLERVKLAFLLMIAYTVNPMAIFRVIGYTESLFATLSTLFIWICLPQLKLKEYIKIIFISILAFLMALTRPVLIQILFSSIAALCTIFCFEILKRKEFNFKKFQKYIHEIKMTLTIWISSLLGYSIYGNFCLKTRGNFFAPFLEQQIWGKKLGLHLELLFFPKSLLFDILGLYFALILLAIAFIFVYCKTIQAEPYIYKPESFLWNILFVYPPLLVILYSFNYFRFKKNKVNKLAILDYTYSLSKNYIFWFCLYFAAIHSIIVFFTQDRLFSLARFVFALPFFFMALGYIYRCIPGKTKYSTLIWFTLISAIFLVQQWVNYGQNKWLG